MSDILKVQVEWIPFLSYLRLVRFHRFEKAKQAGWFSCSADLDTKPSRLMGCHTDTFHLQLVYPKMQETTLNETKESSTDRSSGPSENTPLLDKVCVCVCACTYAFLKG